MNTNRIMNTNGALFIMTEDRAERIKQWLNEYKSDSVFVVFVLRDSNIGIVHEGSVISYRNEVPHLINTARPLYFSPQNKEFINRGYRFYYKTTYSVLLGKINDVLSPKSKLSTDRSIDNVITAMNILDTIDKTDLPFEDFIDLLTNVKTKRESLS